MGRPRSIGPHRWAIVVGAAPVAVLLLGWLVRSDVTGGDAGAGTAAEQTAQLGARAGSSSAEYGAGPTQSEPPTEVRAARRAARRLAGGNLVREVNLRLTPEAWATLADGDADARIMTALLELAVRHQHRIDVAELPRSAADRRSGVPARSAVVTAVDGVPVAETAQGVADVQRILDGLRRPYRPDRVAVRSLDGGPALVVAYDSASPAGLLPQPFSPPR